MIDLRPPMWTIATVVAVFALAVLFYRARRLIQSGRRRPPYLRCAHCGGIIPPGWPVTSDGVNVAHRFRTQCIPKDPK